MIELKHVSQRIQGQDLLVGVDLQIAPGDFVCLQGSNDSGASALLKVIAGILKPSLGQVLFDGIDISRIPPKGIELLRKNIGYCKVTQQLPDYATVLEAIRLPLELHGYSKASIQKRLRWLLKHFQLQAHQDMPVTKLRNDTYALVNIARMLALQPMIICIDEPWLHLTEETSELLSTVLHRIQGLGATVIVASNPACIPEQLPLRIVQMHDGQIIGETHPERRETDVESNTIEHQILSETIQKALETIVKNKPQKGELKRGPLRKRVKITAIK